MSIVDHKCPACNAELKFNPTTQSWVCGYCGSNYKLEDLKADESKNKNADVNRKKSANISYRGYNCPDCGAEIIMDENTSATECIYCGNTAIITERLQGEFSPKQVIPFRKTKEDAINAFMTYKKGKWFMPKEFLDKKNIEKISGIYIPFYLYDMYVDARIDVEATRTKTWSDRNYRYKQTDYYNVLRAGNMTFDMIPTDASKKFPDDIMDSIEPYDYNDLTDFDASYMSGFLSEKYDIAMDELQERAEKRAKQSAEQELLNNIAGYDSKHIKNSIATAKKEDSKYVLLPVWMLNVKYEDKMYTLAMNGQTGKFIGNVPISKKKVLKYWLGFFAGTAAISIILNLMGLFNLFG